MKPPPFAYCAVETVEEALDVLREHGDEAKVLAGGQSLVPMLNLRLVQPRLLVDVARVDGLRGIAVDGEITVGATTAQADLEVDAAVAARARVFPTALRHVGHVATRTRGTVGGSIVHADPAAELPTLLVALGGVVRVRSAARGEREIDADDLFVGAFSTSLSPDELLVDVSFAPPRRGGAGFAEISRRHGDFAIAAAAVALELDNRGAIGSARIALAGVAATPVRASAAEGLVAGARPGEAGLADEVRQLVASELAPFADVHATAAYRKRVGGVLAARALAQAAAGVTG